MRTLLFGIALLLVAALAACGDSPTQTGPLRGTYTLVAIGGAPVPAVAGNDMLGNPLTVLDGTLQLRESDFTFRYRTRAMGGEGGLNVYGTVERSGNAVTLTDNYNGDKLTGTETEQGLTVNWNGWRFDFKKR